MLLTLEISRPLWRALPLIEFVQFPWRFLVLTVLGGSLAGAHAIERLGGADQRRRWLLAALALGATLLAYLPYTTPQFTIFDLTEQSIVSGPYPEMLEKLADGERYVRFEPLMSAEFVRRSGVTGTMHHEYLPLTVSELPAQLAPSTAEVQGGELLEVERLRTNAYRLRIRMEEPGRVTLNQFYFPGWRVELDGHTVRVEPEPGRGRVTWPVPAGEHHSLVYSGFALPFMRRS